MAIVLEVVQEGVAYSHSGPLLGRAHFGRGGAEVPGSRDLVWVLKAKCSCRAFVEESRRGATEISATSPNSHSSHSCVHACVVFIFMQDSNQHIDSARSRSK